MQHKSGYSAAWFSAFDWGSKGREFESLYPDHFFVLYNPVLYGWIFLYPAFTQ